MKMWICLSVMAASMMVSGSPAEADDKDKKKNVAPLLKRKMKSLSGKTVDMAKYQGKVLLIVNTASECGLTPHYEGLQELHERYGKEGLAVLGFPCNQFGGQEPGSAKEIRAFCTKNYGVEFDMFAKIDVNGENRDDLYKYLTSLDTKPKPSGDVKWNFEKFVVDRKGKVVARFQPNTKPDDEKLVGAIEAQLKQN